MQGIQRRRVRGQNTRRFWLQALSTGSMLISLVFFSACSKESRCSANAQCEEGFFCNFETETCSRRAEDARPGCPIDTHICPPEVPMGWVGPNWNSQAEGSEPASCDGGENAEVGVWFAGLEASGACECSCSGNALSVACGPGRVYPSNGTGVIDCAQNATVDSSRPVNAGGTSCTPMGSPSNPPNLAAAPALKLNPGTVSNRGTCSPASLNNTLSSSFSTKQRGCEAVPEPSYTCTGKNSCVARESQGQDFRLCIFREGVHQCPLTYPHLRPSHLDIEDGRSCGACGCEGPPLGENCRGTFTLGTSTGGGCVNGSTHPAGICVNNTLQAGVSGASYSPVLDYECTSNGGQILGEAMAIDPVTICCSEEL